MTSEPSTVDPAILGKVGYGTRGWNVLTGGLIGPIAEKKARALHDAGKPYAVAYQGTGADGLPVVDITRNQYGTTVTFYEHDPGQPNLVHFWKPVGDGGRLRLVQVDRRAGHPDRVPREQLAYEYLLLGDDPATWQRMAPEPPATLGTRHVDLAPFDLDPPAFGDDAPLLDRTVSFRLWPDLPELAWIPPTT